MDRNVKRIVILAMLTALTALATMFLKIPTGIGGYMNLGDAVILSGSAVIGPWVALPAAVGCAFADLLLGYVSYIPATLLIKSLMGLFAGKYLSHHAANPRAIGVMALCEGFMVIGYLLFEIMVFGKGYALASILSNVLQAVLSILAAVALLPFTERVRASLR